MQLTYVKAACRTLVKLTPGHWNRKSLFLTLSFIPCVPGILAFINRNQTSNFFLLWLYLNRLRWKFIKNLRPKPICHRVFEFANEHSHMHACKIDCFMNNKNNNFIYNLLQLTKALKAMIPGTHSTNSPQSQGDRFPTIRVCCCCCCCWWCCWRWTRWIKNTQKCLWVSL